MSAQFHATAAAHPPQVRGKTGSTTEPAPQRAALIAPAGLFRDALAYLVATQIAEIRIECCERVEEIAPGATRLALIAFDPAVDDRKRLQTTIDAVRARCEGAAIGVVTTEERAPGAASFGALGVAGVVSLSAGIQIALAAVRLMLLGGYCLPPEKPQEATHLLNLAAPPIAPPVAPPARSNEHFAAAPYAAGPDLTAREVDVLRSLRAGNQNKIIAFELGISESTVKVHLRNIMKKLHASNRTQVALGAPSPRRHGPPLVCIGSDPEAVDEVRFSS